MKLQWCILYILISIMVIGCDDPLPITDMTSAHQEIERANRVNAVKYAAEELSVAREKLIESHQYVKDEKVEQAKNSAHESYVHANKAYLQSVPLLAGDTITIAETSLKAAEAVYAEKLAKGDYLQAKQYLTKAHQQYSDKKFYESYMTALDADKTAKNARVTALGKKGVLKDAIAEVKETIDEAQKYGAEQYEPQKYNLAQEYTVIAEKAEESEDLKKGFSAVEIAKLNADEAYISALQNSSKLKLDEANKAIENAEKSDGAKTAVDELQGAKESYINASTLHSEARYKESISASDETIKLAQQVILSKPQERVEDRVGNVENKVEEKEPGDGDSDKEYYYYTVRSWQKYRDCLWRISKKYYKNPYLWKKIYNANKDKIGNPHLIRPGWKIRIPKLKQ